MENKKQIIPRNVLNKGDTFPIDCIGHFEIEMRQMPYIITGVAGAFTVNVLNLTNLKYRIIISVVSIGVSYVISLTKYEGQSLETIIINLIKYIYNKHQLKRGKYNVIKNPKNRIFKFTFKNRRNKVCDH